MLPCFLSYHNACSDAILSHEGDPLDLIEKQHNVDVMEEAKNLFYEGNRAMAAGDMSRAEGCFADALRLVPDFAEALANLGFLRDQQGQQVEAEYYYIRSISYNPYYMQPYLNLGVLYARQKRFAEAEDAYRQAMVIDPLSPLPWSNLGALQASLKRDEEAEQSFRRAIELDAEYQLAYFNYSYLLLRQGRYEEGWRCLEFRNWYRNLEKHLPCPRWQGESLEGKAILIGYEAGHGDMIMLCRYAASLKARGAETIDMLCHPALKRLFASLVAVDRVLSFDEPLPPTHWDYWTPPFSIAYHCQTRLDTIPAALPYLQADRDKIASWAARLMVDEHPAEKRVGLVWKGNPQFESDADRSLASLHLLAPLGKIAGVRFVSLQKGAGEDEAAHPPRGLPLINIGPELSDFADTAAVVENLDLVICVDTAVAHLAGALNKQCWVLLPAYTTDWRWLEGRTDSPWYPEVMRLFRQQRMGDWSTVIEEVCALLQEFAANSIFAP